MGDEGGELHTHWATVPPRGEILYSLALISLSELSYLFVIENLCFFYKVRGTHRVCGFIPRACAQESIGLLL